MIFNGFESFNSYFPFSPAIIFALSWTLILAVCTLSKSTHLTATSFVSSVIISWGFSNTHPLGNWIVSKVSPIKPFNFNPDFSKSFSNVLSSIVRITALLVDGFVASVLLLAV